MTGCEIINCAGKTIMPGIINGHTHLFMEPYTWDRGGVSKRAVSSICLRIMDNMKKALRSGVTFVRDLAAFPALT